jgi:hypothetical protein
MDRENRMNPSELIDKQIADLTGWRQPVFARLRELIHAADPALTEEWKWDTGVWTRNGMVCSVSAFKNHVKINFFKGAALPDPHGLFNSGLEAKAMRSIDFFEGDAINEPALIELIREAVAHNQAGRK